MRNGSSSHYGVCLCVCASACLWSLTNFFPWFQRFQNQKMCFRPFWPTLIFEHPHPLGTWFLANLAWYTFGPLSSSYFLSRPTLISSISISSRLGSLQIWCDTVLDRLHLTFHLFIYLFSSYSSALGSESIWLDTFLDPFILLFISSSDSSSPYSSGLGSLQICMIHFQTPFILSSHFSSLHLKFFIS